MKAGPVVAVSCLFSIAVLSVAQDASDWGTRSVARDRSNMGSPFDRTPSEETGAITGTVVTPDGRPQSDVLVQIQGFASGRVVASSHTDISGAFRFNGLPYGMYEIIANLQAASVRQEVEVQNGFAIVSLRLETSDPHAIPSSSGLVSAAELMAPQRARNAYQKAEQAIAKHRTEDTSKYLEKALKIYPSYAPALTLRGALSLDKEDLAAALDDFKKAIQADSTYAMAYGAMAAALNRLNRFDEALRAAERASSLSPNSWQPYFEMAKSYAAKTDYTRALQQLAHAQGQLRAEWAPLHLLRANVLLGLNNYADAADELQIFLQIAPKDPNASAVRETLDQINVFIVSKRIESH